MAKMAKNGKIPELAKNRTLNWSKMQLLCKF